MPGNPVKFRCYRCNQLLGISRSKIGATISCPKCQVSLVVPDPGEGPQEDAPPPGPEASHIFLGGSTAGSSDSILDIRPEDIRVEPGLLYSPPLPPPPEEPPPVIEPTPPPPPPPIHPEMMAAAAVPAPAAVPRPAVRPAPPPPAPSPVEPPPAFTRDDEPVIPPIEVNGPRRPAERPPVLARARDVVLPRSVVLAWSLFVLLALTLAFTAGLLAGHYIWRVH